MRWLRVSLLVALTIATAACVVMMMQGFFGQLMFEPDSTDLWDAYVARPLMQAGFVGAGLGVAGIVAWIIARGRRWLAWIALGLLMLTLFIAIHGEMVHADREHPGPSYMAMLSSLRVPSGFSVVSTGVSCPDGTFMCEPSAATIWSTPLSIAQGCPLVAEAVRSWADPGSLRFETVDPNSYTNGRCSMSATFDGLMVNVDDTAGPSSGPWQVTIEVDRFN